MQKILTSIIAVSAVTAAISSATTVGFSQTGTSRVIVKQDLTTQVATGVNSLVWVGSFALTGSALDTAVAAVVAATTPAETVQNVVDRMRSTANGGPGWTQFVPTGANTLTVSGTTGSSRVAGAVTDNTAAASAFNSLTTYLWIIDSSNLSALASSVQMGIYTSIEPTTTDWIFPINGAAPDTLNAATAPSNTSIKSIGGQGIVSSTQLVVETVPEPSSVLLSVMGLTAMAARRRRTRY